MQLKKRGHRRRRAQGLDISQSGTGYNRRYPRTKTSLNTFRVRVQTVNTTDDVAVASVRRRTLWSCTVRDGRAKRRVPVGHLFCIRTACTSLNVFVSASVSFARSAATLRVLRQHNENATRAKTSLLIARIVNGYVLSHVRNAGKPKPFSARSFLRTAYDVHARQTADRLRVHDSDA